MPTTTRLLTPRTSTGSSTARLPGSTARRVRVRIHTRPRLLRRTTEQHPGQHRDLLGQLRASFSDPVWSTPTTLFTGFAFTGLIYFTFCFGMSRYSLFVENRLNAHRRN